MDIYSSAQLGSENQCIELLQIGSLDITKVSSAALEGFADPFKVFGIPYLFRSREQFFEVLDGSVGKRNLIGLGDSLILTRGPVAFIR